MGSLMVTIHKTWIVMMKYQLHIHHISHLSTNWLHCSVCISLRKQNTCDCILNFFLFAEDAQLSAEWIKPLTSVILEIKYLTSSPNCLFHSLINEGGWIHKPASFKTRRNWTITTGIMVSRTTSYHQTQCSLLRFHQIHYVLHIYQGQQTFC